MRGSCPAAAHFENSLKGDRVGAEDVKGVKMVVVAVVAGVELLLIRPGVHTSCSNDRFELTRANIRDSQ